MILILFIITAAGAMNQVVSSTVAGAVRDQSSTLVSAATITARHEPTGFTRTILRSDEGEYSIDRLVPGSYTVTVDNRGFRTVTAASATLAANQKGRLDFELQPGPAADSITKTDSGSIRVDHELNNEQAHIARVFSLLPAMQNLPHSRWWLA